MTGKFILARKSRTNAGWYWTEMKTRKIKEIRSKSNARNQCIYIHLESRILAKLLSELQIPRFEMSRATTDFQVFFIAFVDYFCPQYSKTVKNYFDRWYSPVFARMFHYSIVDMSTRVLQVRSCSSERLDPG